ncbi:MAG TPA: hypothetical protein VGQ00_03540 [Candidatus Norongarragalinales archaeon]|jgi:hypothetical protein|nr:hypothetical protein [Candidatus Norongarragalinales archaeon]
MSKLERFMRSADHNVLRSHLQKMKDPEKIILAIKHPYPEIRIEALELFARSDRLSPEIIRKHVPLIIQYGLYRKDAENYSERHLQELTLDNLGRLLGRTGVSPSVEEMVTVSLGLNHSSWKVRERSALALLVMKDPRAIANLEQALKKERQRDIESPGYGEVPSMMTRGMMRSAIDFLNKVKLKRGEHAH